MNTYGIEAKNIKYGETSFHGDVLMDKIKIGVFENEGKGGHTEIHLDRNLSGDFHDRMISFFKSINMIADENHPKYSLEYTFIEYLLDLEEFGVFGDDKDFEFLT